MDQAYILNETVRYARETLEGEGSGHDWFHIHRVWNLAKTIQKNEGGDLFIIELGALLHDIADWKFTGGDESVGPNKAREFLSRYKLPNATIDHVCDMIATISYKGAGVDTPMKTIEGKIVQDADRLDAIGAMGIARCFVYSGHKGRLIYHPDIKPVMHDSSEAYKNDEGTAINHFYEKLFLLKDRMNTESAKKMAEDRHKFMEEYVGRFLQEWEGTI